MKHPHPQAPAADGALLAPAVRRRKPAERSSTVERKLKTDIEAWLRERRSLRRKVPAPA